MLYKQRIFMKHFCATLIALTLITSGAHASGSTEKFTLDKEHTTVGFSVRYLIFAKVKGQFKDFKGTFVIDPEQPDNNRVDITVQTASVRTGIKTRDEDIRGPGLFNAAIHPTMTFHSNIIEMRDNNTGRIKGNLTLLGITKPIILDLVKTAGADQNLSSGFKVTGKIKRSDFGMNAYVQPIGNTVTLLVCYNTRECTN